MAAVTSTVTLIDQRRQVPYGAIEAKAAVVVQVHERHERVSKYH